MKKQFKAAIAFVLGGPMGGSVLAAIAWSQFATKKACGDKQVLGTVRSGFIIHTALVTPAKCLNGFTSQNAFVAATAVGLGLLGAGIAWLVTD